MYTTIIIWRTRQVQKIIIAVRVQSLIGATVYLPLCVGRPWVASGRCSRCVVMLLMLRRRRRQGIRSAHVHLCRSAPPGPAPPEAPRTQCTHAHKFSDDKWVHFVFLVHEGRRVALPHALSFRPHQHLIIHCFISRMSNFLSIYYEKMESV